MDVARRWWSALDRRARMLACALACAALVAAGLAVALQRDERVALFAAPLRADQVEEVSERLAEWDVPFVAAADDVRVDAKRRNDLLLKLAALGIPHAHLGSLDDALAKAGPLTPQSVLDSEALDGRAGDLASGLRGVAGVQDARVVIAPAREATFADDGASHEATASVRLTVRPGAELSKATVAALRAYVAAGVPGLAADRVAILDDRGSTFDDSAETGNESASMQASLQSALDQSLGAGVAIVRVHVDRDPRSSRRRDFTRRALGAAIGTTTSSERYKSATKTYSKSNAALDAGSDVRDENVETPPGATRRISVAVAVDAAHGADLAKVESIARATLGLDRARGDVVSVTAIAFPKESRSRGRAWLFALSGLLGDVVPPILVAIVLLAAIKYGAKPFATACETLANRATVERASRAVAGFAPAHVRGALENEPPHTAAAIISALPAATATAVLEMYPAEERAAIVRRMSRAASPAVPDHETVLRRA